MNEKHAGSGPNWLLLAIPAGMLLAAKARHHHRLMWEADGADAGAPGFARGRHGHGHGHHGRGPWAGGDPTSFRLPPRIESILEAWHRKAHETPESTAAETPAAKD